MLPSVLSALKGSLNILKHLAGDQFSSGFYFAFIVNVMLSCFLNTTSVSVIACISKYCSPAIEVTLLLEHQPVVLLPRGERAGVLRQVRTRNSYTPPFYSKMLYKH